MWTSIQKIRTWLYQQGWQKRYRLPAYTISVGNISLGGTGKSPLTERIARHYLSQGKKVVLLSRGYGRKSKAEIVLPPKQAIKKEYTASELGDEPFMLLQRLPDLGLVIAPNRGQVASENWAKIAADIVILDDGFQHLAVERDLDIVMIDQTTSPRDRVLPFGRLREPLSSLYRADMIVLHRSSEASEQQKADWKNTLENILGSSSKIFSSSVSSAGWVTMPQKVKSVVSKISGKNIFLVTGVARPESVFNSYKLAGANIFKHIVLPDHAYLPLDQLRNWLGFWKEEPELVLAYTEKDAARWAEQLQNFPHPHGYLQIELDLDPQFWNFLAEASNV